MGLTFNQLAVRNSILHYAGPLVYYTQYDRLNTAFRQMKSKNEFTDALLADGGRVKVKSAA
jgi:hypothetical protein